LAEQRPFLNRRFATPCGSVALALVVALAATALAHAVAPPVPKDAIEIDFRTGTMSGSSKSWCARISRWN
jgi:hypothetical protein